MITFSSVGLTAILEKISSIPVMDMIITDFDIINANDEIQEWCYYPMVKIQTVYYINNVLYCYLLGREGQTMSESVLKKKIAI